MTAVTATPRADVYRCPSCGGLVDVAGERLACRGCARRYEIRRGIPVFLERPRYWGNVPRETMERLVEAAEGRGWREAIRELLPPAVWSHIEEPGRADGAFFVPMPANAVALDAGCMWGGLTLPLARRCARVHAIDATLESLDFLRVRVGQEGVDNVELACGGLLALPYRDALFDVVFVNGVLEWVPLAADFVVERDYGQRQGRLERDRRPPGAMQAQALREVCRVLKPGGVLYLAIENRFAYKYFLGSPDDHSALRFTSLVPRAIADLYMRLRLRQQYRTYTYSSAGLRRLLRRSGFEVRELFACCDSYRDPQAVIPLDQPRMIDFYFREFRLGNVPRWKRWLFRSVLACGLGPAVVPSFIALAMRPAGGSR